MNKDENTEFNKLQKSMQWSKALQLNKEITYDKQDRSIIQWGSMDEKPEVSFLSECSSFYFNLAVDTKKDKSRFLVRKPVPQARRTIQVVSPPRKK